MRSAERRSSRPNIWAFTTDHLHLLHHLAIWSCYPDVILYSLYESATIVRYFALSHRTRVCSGSESSCREGNVTLLLTAHAVLPSARPATARLFPARAAASRPSIAAERRATAGETQSRR